MYELPVVTLHRLNQTIVDEAIVPQSRLFADEGIAVKGRVHRFGVELAYDVRSRTDMIAVRMRTDVEFKIVFGDAKHFHIGNDLGFDTLPNRDAAAQRVALIGSIGRQRVFSRIYNAELTVTFDDDGVSIVVGHHMNAHFAVFRRAVSQRRSQQNHHKRAQQYAEHCARQTQSPLHNTNSHITRNIRTAVVYQELPRFIPLPRSVHMIATNPLTRSHSTGRFHIVVSDPTVRLHRTGTIRVIPRPSNLVPTRRHGARAFQVIPRLAQVEPARRHVARTL